MAERVGNVLDEAHDAGVEAAAQAVEQFSSDDNEDIDYSPNITVRAMAAAIRKLKRNGD